MAKISQNFNNIFNPTKTECMTFSVKRIKPPHLDLFYGDNKIIEVSQHTHLGVVLCNNLSWRAHIFKIYEKASKRLNMLKGIKLKCVLKFLLRSCPQSLLKCCTQRVKNIIMNVFRLKTLSTRSTSAKTWTIVCHFNPVQSQYQHVHSPHLSISLLF